MIAPDFGSGALAHPRAVGSNPTVPAPTSFVGRGTCQCKEVNAALVLAHCNLIKRLTALHAHATVKMSNVTLVLAHCRSHREWLSGDYSVRTLSNREEAMNPDAHPFERETEQAIAARRQDVDELRARLRAMEEEIQRKESEIKTFEDALHLWRQDHGVPQPAPSPNEQLRLQFAGMPLGKRLVAIARRNNGTLNVREASRMLVRAGMYEDPVKASAAIYPILGRGKWKGMFRKTSPGLYRLVDQPARPPVPQDVPQSGQRAPSLPTVARPAGSLSAIGHPSRG